MWYQKPTSYKQLNSRKGLYDHLPEVPRNSIINFCVNNKSLFQCNNGVRQGRRFIPSSVYLTTVALEGRKEISTFFNDALNTFYLRLYGVEP